MALHRRRLEAEIWRMGCLERGLNAFTNKGNWLSSLMWLPRAQVPFSCPFVLLILTLLAVIWSQVAAAFLGFVLRRWPQQKLVLLPWVTVSWPGKPLGVWWQTSCPVFFVRVSSGPSETSCGHARQSLTGVGKHLAVWERMGCRAIPALREKRWSEGWCWVEGSQRSPWRFWFWNRAPLRISPKMW